MVDWTYTHFRVWMRLLAPRSLLYTEMQTTGAILHHPKRALAFHPVESPLALQIGGADIDELTESAIAAASLGFCEINLNLGCPSDRVQAGRFGACLMAEPLHVARCIEALKKAVSLPITAKTRIGINQQDSYAFFSDFAKQLLSAGCDKLIVHARKAWLNGLNPKQNRTIPPLHYDYVYKIKKHYPHVPVVINGNIQTMDDITHHLTHVDGVMLGRLACNHPYAVAEIHHHLYPDEPLLSRVSYLKAYSRYLEEAYEQGVPLSILLKPILSLVHGLAHAKVWKEKVLLLTHNKNRLDMEPIISLLAEIEGHSAQRLPL